MEKLAVVEDTDTKEKLGSSDTPRCPSCSGPVEVHNVLKCPKCGTKPFEVSKSNDADRR